MVKVAIAGITGFTGLELLRYLSHHREVEIISFISKTHAGRRLSDAGVFVDDSLNFTLEPPDTPSVQHADVLFSCLPHRESAAHIKEWLNKKPSLKVIDLSADFRFKDPLLYEKVYESPHPFSQNYPCPAYGLSELNRDKIKNAQIIANPGCYPTGFLLSAYPLAKDGIADNFIYDAKSGISGAGRSPSHASLYSELEEDMRPYSVFKHRHQMEMEHQLTLLTGLSCSVSFTPQVIPASRGILGVLYASLKKKVALEELRAKFIHAYCGENFVKILPEGVEPRTKAVRGTNYCLIQIYLNEKTNTAAVVSAIDNLGKGASGQAVQNFNILMGFDEREGMPLQPLFP